MSAQGFPQLTEQEATQREGWVIALVNKAFPDLKRTHPVKYDSTVRILFDYSLAHPHADRTDPFDLRHGTFKTPHAAEVASERWLHRPKQSRIFAAIQAGNTEEAASLLGIQNYKAGYPPLPQKLDHGELAQAKMPSTWQQVKGTVHDLPGAVVDDVGKVGGGLADIGGWFKNPTVLVIIVLVLILVVKK